MIAVPQTYATAANYYLVEALAEAVSERDWDAVEAITAALHDFAQTFTKPGGKNA